jgi:hypothetical protein
MYVCSYDVKLRSLVDDDPHMTGMCQSTLSIFYDTNDCCTYFETMNEFDSYHEGCDSCMVDKYNSLHDKAIFVFEYSGDPAGYRFIGCVSSDMLPAQELLM